MTSKKDRMWQSPWGFCESFAIVGGVIIVGLALQIAIGQFDFYLLSQPINKVVTMVIIAISVLLGLLSKTSKFARWITSVPLSVSLISGLLLLSIVMGTVVQRVESSTLVGFDTMTNNWAFVAIYLITLISLGALIVRRATKFRFKDYSFYLNHIGLWILLVASGLGYADMERYIMYVDEGETQWRVYGDDNSIKELPIAIQLKDFDMDVYPPKLAIIDRSTGSVQPESKPQFFQIEEDLSSGSLNGWTISVEDYIHKAVRSSDSTYRAVPMAGATPAISVIATRGEQIRKGWISGGNRAQIYMTLPLDDDYSMVMTSAEPRVFSSDVIVFTKDGDRVEGIVEVNHPISIGDWMVYQYGYDNDAGSLSSYSSFELVYDPYLKAVYIGIIMLMFGAVTMLWSKKRGAN